MIATEDYSWFKKLGFYRKTLGGHYGDSFVSVEEVLITRKDWEWNSTWNTSLLPDITELKPRFVYSIRNKRIYDSLNSKNFMIESVEELVDFITGNFTSKIEQLDRNKGIWDQMDNTVPYTRGRFDRGLLDEMFHFDSPRTERQLRIQTSEAGMEEFRRALEQDSDIWRQTRLTETPMLDMSSIQTQRIDGTQGAFPYINMNPSERRSNPYSIWLRDSNHLFTGRGYEPRVPMNQELLDIVRQTNIIDEQARN